MLRAAREVQSIGRFTGTSNVGFLIPYLLYKMLISILGSYGSQVRPYTYRHNRAVGFSSGLHGNS
jgi:hypothetical protein